MDGCDLARPGLQAQKVSTTNYLNGYEKVVLASELSNGTMYTQENSTQSSLSSNKHMDTSNSMQGTPSNGKFSHVDKEDENNEDSEDNPNGKKRKKTKSLYKGVFRCGKKFKAQIQTHGVQHYLGEFLFHSMVCGSNVSGVRPL